MGYHQKAHILDKTLYDIFSNGFQGVKSLSSYSGFMCYEIFALSFVLTGIPAAALCKYVYFILECALYFGIYKKKGAPVSLQWELEHAFI